MSASKEHEAKTDAAAVALFNSGGERVVVVVALGANGEYDVSAASRPGDMEGFAVSAMLAEAIHAAVSQIFRTDPDAAERSVRHVPTGDQS